MDIVFVKQNILTELVTVCRRKHYLKVSDPYIAQNIFSK